MQRNKAKTITVIVCCFILLCYPLRHVTVGLDLWDGGYNYSNFKYFSLEYMDSMWFFATWLATAVGSLFTHLPFGNTLAGMNVYTGLVVSSLAVSSFLFCVRRIKMPVWAAFTGSLLAVSLCWAPTSALYNYLTYALLFAGTALLYQGLSSGQKHWLILAGVMLGINVGVRFSNLSQTGLIAAVWVYGLLRHKKRKEVLQDTGWCILGYVSALGVFLSVISCLYGMPAYISGIRQLFAMTEVATDYTPLSMLIGMVQGYYDSIYWLKRFALILATGILICLILPRRLRRIKQSLTVLLTLALFLLLRQKGFYARYYTTYNAIYTPCVIALLMTICLSLRQIFNISFCRTLAEPDCSAQRSAPPSPEERLLACLVLLTILLSSLGSNNAMYAAINNLFLVLPYLLWQTWKFCTEELPDWLFPIKSILVMVTAIVLVQSLRFGHFFIYEEATGCYAPDTLITDIPVAKGIRTAAEKADWVTETFLALEEQQLLDREYILYGQLPGLSYYLELTPAFNIWGDLRSYQYAVMQKDLLRVQEEIEHGADAPVVILAASHVQYLEDGNADGVFFDPTEEPKLRLIENFLRQNSYAESFRNSHCVVYTYR